MAPKNWLPRKYVIITKWRHPIILSIFGISNVYEIFRLRLIVFIDQILANDNVVSELCGSLQLGVVSSQFRYSIKQVKMV